MSALTAAAARSSQPLPGRWSAGDIQNAESVRLRANLVSVKDFGAVGDGITVDTAAVNRAIASCSAEQTLHFPAGIYIVDNSDPKEGGKSSTAALPNGVNVLMDEEAWVRRQRGERRGVNFFMPTTNNILQVNVDGDEYPGSMAGLWATAQCVGVYGEGCNGVQVVNSHFRHVTYGVRMVGAVGCRISACQFYRVGLSGILVMARPLLLVSHNVVDGCTFEEMGDTAAAFSLTQGGQLTYNAISNCRAKNTQLRALGYAFDIEGGYGFGTIHNNNIIGNIVEQIMPSRYGQGGITMNLYSENGLIAQNILIGNLNQTSDVGIMIPRTRGIEVRENSIRRFRGGAVAADGADRAIVRQNTIGDCGDATVPGVPLFSGINAGYVEGSTNCLIEHNALEWSGDYPFLGAHAAAISARRYGAYTVRGLTIRGNRIRNRLGAGILVYGFREPGFGLSEIRIHSNIIVDDSSRGGRAEGPAIVARYVDHLEMRDNEVPGGPASLDLDGSVVTSA